MFRRSSGPPESANSLIGGGIIAIVVGAVMFAFIAADGFGLGGTGRELWGCLMAPLGVVMLVVGIVKRSRGQR